MFDGVLSALPPFQVALAGDLQVKAQTWVFMLRDLARGNDMPLEEDILPRLLADRAWMMWIGEEGYEPISA